METLTNDKRELIHGPENIEGWGIDADPENDPTYPIKHTTGADHERLDYERPPQQLSSMEILRSSERPRMTAVFGTSIPPIGLSGILRRFAFRFSEGQAAHWLTLILADRVNAVEGIVDDLRRGYVPNIFKERGWTAEWKYNRKDVVKKLVVGTVVTSAIITLLVYRKKNKRLRFG